MAPPTSTSNPNTMLCVTPWSSSDPPCVLGLDGVGVAGCVGGLIGVVGSLDVWEVVGSSAKEGSSALLDPALPPYTSVSILAV
jgi:hypothetical protein